MTPPTCTLRSGCLRPSAASGRSLVIPQINTTSPAYTGMMVIGSSSGRGGAHGGIRVLTTAPALTDAIEVAAVGTVLRDFAIDGVSNSTGKCRNGIVMYFGNQAIIENVLVSNCTNDGIQFNEVADGLTTSATAIASGTQIVTPASMSPNGMRIAVGTVLNIDGGTEVVESVIVSAVTGTTFTATFANAHNTVPVQIRVKGSNNMATLRDCRFALNGTWGVEILGGYDENAMHFENLFLDNNGNSAGGPRPQGGMLLRGFGHTILSGLYEGNFGPAIQLG